MNFENISIGTDIEEIKRFANKTLEKDSAFLNRIFTSKELEYSFKSKTSAHHLCARFCVKEAVIKVLAYKGIKHSKLNNIEVYKGKYGEPYVRLLDCEYSNLRIDISIAHEKTKAIAIAMIKD